VKAVTVDQVRAEHRRLYVNPGDGNKNDAERQAWSRAMKAARGLYQAENTEGDQQMIWIPLGQPGA